MRKEVSSATGISDGMSAAEGCDMERSPARPEGWICSMLSEHQQRQRMRVCPPGARARHSTRQKRPTTAPAGRERDLSAPCPSIAASAGTLKPHAGRVRPTTSCATTLSVPTMGLSCIRRVSAGNDGVMRENARSRMAATREGHSGVARNLRAANGGQGSVNADQQAQAVTYVALTVSP